MHCPKCAAAVDPEDLFCLECGTRLATFRIGELACRQCGSLLVRIGQYDRCPLCDCYCTDCGTIVTEKVAVCPGCGLSFKKEPKKRSPARFPKADHPLYKSLAYAGYAGFFVRLLALAADVIIMGAIVALAGALLGIRLSFFPFWSVVASLLVPYNSLLVGIRGGTPGMKLYSMRVVNSKADSVGVWKAGLRFLLALVSIATVVGVLMIGFHRYRQALHDIVLKTFVIRVKE